jgi:hypothetical protein
MRLSAEPSWRAAIEHRCPRCLRLSLVIAALVLVAFLFTLTGCVSSLPTMQHCAHVKYERTGTDVKIEARCTAPIGGSGIGG